MKFLVVILAGVLVGTLAACIPATGNRHGLYVIVDPRETNEFLERMGSIAEAHGMTPHFAEDRYPDDNVRHLLEASGNGLRLWLANVPLSGHQDASLCGVSGWPRVDPAQYRFDVGPRFIGNSQKQADSVQASVAQRLEALGYRVLPDPVPCGRAVLLEQGTR